MMRGIGCIVFACLVVWGGAVGCASDDPSTGGGGAGVGAGGAAAANGGPPSRGPNGSADAGNGVVIVDAGGGSAGTGGGAGDAGTPVVACPDGVRGNDIACDTSVDTICLSGCLAMNRIRCGCTSRGPGDDRWVCGGQPMPCQ